MDLLGEAARRHNIPLRFVPVRGMLPDEALRAGVVDLWPAAGVTADRQRWLHVTEPWLKNRYVLVSLAGSGKPDPPVTIAKKRVPIVADMVAKRFPNARFISREERSEVLQLMCSGQVDAAFVEARYLDRAVLDRPAGCETARLRVAFVDEVSLELAILATREHAAEADTLRAEISRLAHEGSTLR